MSPSPPPPLFPAHSRRYIAAFQFSAWHAAFARVSPRAVVTHPLDGAFRAYLEADGVVVPEGADDGVSDPSSDEDDATEPDAPARPRPAFPHLDAQIRAAVREYDAVFPKLNWTAPQDASWILPTLRCTSPADVYLLLKSSDFVSHDVDPQLAFAGCAPGPGPSTASDRPEHPHDLELVLKKWHPMDRGREFRCFVRDEILIGISQRDVNYYPHLNEQDTRDKILRSIVYFWVRHVRLKFVGGGDYVFDIHMTRDLSSAHILDFNPYHPKTDALLFTYDELLQLLMSASTSAAASTPDEPSFTPVLRTITSASHPAAARNAPSNQHNAVPFEALQMSAGNDIGTFSAMWQEELQKSMYEDE
ncbi:D123-domain-containing protein [Gautieria morchelliformis]|nr:D123-domain-containing protein [Gautieria morchelliformis]